MSYHDVDEVEDDDNVDDDESHDIADVIVEASAVRRDISYSGLSDLASLECMNSHWSL